MEKKRHILFRPLTFLILLLTWSYVASENRYRDPNYLGHVFSAPENFSATSTIICAFRCFASKCVYFTYEDGLCKIHYSSSQLFSGAALSSVSYRWQITDTTGLTNVALGKPTLASSEVPNSSPGEAVDGDNYTMYGAMNTNAWWSVDLGNIYTIKAIVILPLPYTPDMFSNAKIYAGSSLVMDGNFSSYTVVGVYPKTSDILARIVFVPPELTQARHLAIQMFSDAFPMYIVEVQVLV